MHIILQPGEVFADVLLNFRTSPNITIKLKSEWILGHVVLINNISILNYKMNDSYSFYDNPKIDISNSSAEVDLVIEVERT